MKTVRQSSLFRVECRHDNSLQRDNFQPMNHFYFIDSKSLTNFGSFITMPFNLISPLSRRRIIYNGFLIKLCSTIDNRLKKPTTTKIHRIEDVHAARGVAFMYNTYFSSTGVC